MTGGEYYVASSADELNRVFASLPTYLKLREETVEISVVFAAAGAALLAAALLLSQLWHPLP
jgi:Ca-activated chloride channel family protein